MFGKKQKPIDEWSFEDKKYKELTESMGNLIKEMTKIIHSIHIRQECADLLPDGADKDIELKDAETYRWKLRNLLSAYDEDYRAWKALDKIKLIHYHDYVEPRNSHDALHLAWMIERRD